MKKNRKLKSSQSTNAEENIVKRSKRDPKNVRRALNQRLKNYQDFESDEFTQLIYDNELDY